MTSNRRYLASLNTEILRFVEGDRFCLFTGNKTLCVNTTYKYRTCSLCTMKGVLRKFARFFGPALGLKVFEDYATRLAFVVAGGKLHVYAKEDLRTLNPLCVIDIPDQGGGLLAILWGLIHVYWHYRLIREWDSDNMREDCPFGYFSPWSHSAYKPPILDRVGICYARHCAWVYAGTPVGSLIVLPPKCECSDGWKKLGNLAHENPDPFQSDDRIKFDDVVPLTHMPNLKALEYEEDMRIKAKFYLESKFISAGVQHGDNDEGVAYSRPHIGCD